MKKNLLNYFKLNEWILAPNVILLLTLLLFSACSVKTVEVIILRSTPSVIEIYNGKTLLLNDSLKTINMDDISKAFTTKYNFSDSIYVKIKPSNSFLRVKRTKLSENKYIYIEIDGSELKVYGLNKRKRSI